MIGVLRCNQWRRVLECRQGMIAIPDDAVVVPDEEIPAAA